MLNSVETVTNKIRTKQKIKKSFARQVLKSCLVVGVGCSFFLLHRKIALKFDENALANIC